jgi:hypothetical protein
MGRIDQVYAAADGRTAQLLHHNWLLLVLLTVATVLAYALVSVRRRTSGSGRND